MKIVSGRKKSYRLPAAAALLFALLVLGALFRIGHKTVVLGYHSVSEEPFSDAESLFVRPSELEEQIKTLKEGGWEFIFASEVNGRSLKRQVCLTFDDGYADNLTVLLPILEKYGAKATVFVVPDLVDFNERFLSMAQLQALAQSPLIEIGSHGMSHREFSGLSLEEVKKELKDSKTVLQVLTGQKIDCFAYPGGHYTREEALAAAELYDKCFTFSGARQYVSIFNKPELIPRISVYRGTEGRELLHLIRTARPGRNVDATY